VIVTDFSKENSLGTKVVYQLSPLLVLKKFPFFPALIAFCLMVGSGALTLAFF
jgi:hypothetical protein